MVVRALNRRIATRHDKIWHRIYLRTIPSASSRIWGARKVLQGRQMGREFVEARTTCFILTQVPMLRIGSTDTGVHATS